MIELFCIKYADSTLRESLAFLGGSAEKEIPITFAVYLLKADGRNILVDAGCDNMPGFVMRNFFSPAFLLRQLDVTADEIDDVIITHAHHDHIEAIDHFKNATVHITKPELERAGRYPLKNTKVIEEDFYIADKVKIVRIGGHSIGSVIVEIETENGTAILCGDECYTNENIEKKIPTGTTENAEKSREFVEKYSRRKVFTCHDKTLKTEKVIL